MLAWLSVWSEVQTCIWPSWCHCHSLFLASVKSRLVLPFWYRLTRVVPEKGSFNMHMCAVVRSLYFLTCFQGICLCLQCFVAVGWATTEWWGAGVVICLERGADLHMVQLMPLPLTVSCFGRIQIGFTFLVLAQLSSSGKRAVKCACLFSRHMLLYSLNCIYLLL